MQNDLNTCYYSPGTDKHYCCTHPNYCIFNPHRTTLEKNITKLENKQKELQKTIEFIQTEGTDNSADYKQAIKKLNIINEDLEKQLEFRKKVIENEGGIYGYKY